MDDVTDLVFREIISRIAKPDVLFTEFTSADALCSKGHKKVGHRLEYTEKQRPIVAQIWGADPENFKQAATYVQESGFDGIDINMGCPDRSIMQKGCCAALINKKELVEKLIKAVREGAPNLPLSVKTRLDATEELTKEWISFLLSQDINALILHSRTAAELSKVPARWEELGKAVELRNKINPNVTIIGNGDVQSYQEIMEKHKTYDVDGVMVGRGIFYNPWLFEKNESAKTHTPKEYMDLLIQHTKLFNDTWGDAKNFETMKKFFKIYIKDFDGANKFRQQLMEVKSYKEFCNIINK
jgi:tRNA-dihydrouridine synthase